MSSMISLFRSFRDGISLERRRVWWRLLWVATTIKLAYFVAIIALFGAALAHVPAGIYNTLDASSLRGLLSDSLLGAVWLQLIDFAAASATVGPQGGQEAPRAYARLLVNLVAARDSGLAFPVAMEPRADATTEPQTIGPVAHPMRALTLSDWVYFFALLGGLIPIGLGVFMCVISLIMPSPHGSRLALVDLVEWLPMPIIMIMVGIGIIATTLVARRFTRMERQGFLASVDAEGITFRLVGRAGFERRLRWGDVRAFARIMVTDEQRRLHEVFALSGADEDLLWEAMYTAPGASVDIAQREEGMRVAAHRLAEQVALRSGLPLLDVSHTIYAVLGVNGAGAPQLPWSLLHRARLIARAQGDTIFASELSHRIGAGKGLLARGFERLAMRFPKPRSLAPAQRDETLRLARALLPYYPTPAQMTPNLRRRLITQTYWNLEVTFQFLMLIMAFANIFVMTAFIV